MASEDYQRVGIRIMDLLCTCRSALFFQRITQLLQKIWKNWYSILCQENQNITLSFSGPNVTRPAMTELTLPDILHNTPFQFSDLQSIIRRTRIDQNNFRRGGILHMQCFELPGQK